MVTWYYLHSFHRIYTNVIYDCPVSSAVWTYELKAQQSPELKSK